LPFSVPVSLLYILAYWKKVVNRKDNYF